MGFLTFIELKKEIEGKEVKRSTEIHLVQSVVFTPSMTWALSRALSTTTELLLVRLCVSATTPSVSSCHVCLHVSLLNEGLPTHGTGVGSLSGVGPHVFLQITSRRKTLIAQVARVGPLAGMRSHVFFKVPRYGETLLAYRAHMWSVPEVDVHVGLHVALLREPLGTDGT